MGLRATFQAAATAARAAFGDVFEAAEYLPTLAVPTYDATDGSADDLGATPTPVSCLAAFIGYTARERATLAVPPDMDRVLVAAADLVGVVPAPGGLLRRVATSAVVEVVAFENVGGVDALWDLQVRQSAHGWPS